MKPYGFKSAAPYLKPRFLFPKDNDAVTICAAGVVAHAPAVGGLGEVLRVDESILDFQARCNAGEKDLLFEFQLTLAHFTDFERNAPCRFEHACHLAERGGHFFCPILELTQLPELAGLGLALAEPVAQPVVAYVVDDVEKWGRGDDELHGFVLYLRRGVGRAAEQGGAGAIVIFW